MRRDHAGRGLHYRLPVVEPAASVQENIRVTVVVYYHPEAVVLGYQDGFLGVRLRIDTHVVVVYRVGKVRVKVNPNGIEPSSLENLDDIFEIAQYEVHFCGWNSGAVA